SLNVYSINDPSDIYRTGYRNSMARQETIAVSGDYVWAGGGPSSAYLAAYNYEDPFGSANYYGYLDLDGTPTDIEVNGYFVYFTVFNSTSGYSFGVLNAEDQITNVMPYTWSESSLAKGLAIDGDIAYVAAHTDGFYVVDVSNQYSFNTLGWCDTPGNATDVIIDGTIAYVTDGLEGVQVIDVSNPLLPEIIGSYSTFGYSEKLVLQGNTLFIADGLGGIAMCDVANPAHPIYIPPWMLGQYIWDVDLYGGVLVVASDVGIHTYAVGPGITKIQNEVFANPFDQFEVWDVRVKGDIAIVAGGPDGIYTLDVSDKNNPVLLDQTVYDGTSMYRKLDVQGNFAFVADYGSGGGIRAYDISDPSNILYADAVALTYATDVALYGDVAFVADGPAGVYVMNTTDPYNMVYWCSFTDIFTNVTAVAVEGAKLYVVEDIGGSPVTSVRVFDITDINVEIQLGFQALTAQFYDVFIDGDVAYTSDKEWMLPYNVTDPTNPYYTTWTNKYSYGCWGFGPYALSTGDGVSLIDCTDMTAADPTISIYPDATTGHQITTSGDYTYVSNKSNLIILRHFESLADTYVAGPTAAQSLEIDTTDYIIYNATLTPDDYIPAGTTLHYLMSADGGAHWDYVAPGALHTFQYAGNDLRYRIVFSGPKDKSPHVYELNIEYYFNTPPGVPAIVDPGVEIAVSAIEITWTASVEDFGIDHYQLQIDDDSGFTSIINEYLTSDLSQIITGLANGTTYYIRIRAIDVFGLTSPWSSTVDFAVVIPVSVPLPWWAYAIIGGGAGLILLIIIISVAIKKRKKKILFLESLLTN
ncbi:MAG: hypothetical protein ACTSSK_06660, partial [Candidatus Heimdallarchaeota archaeon]